MTDICYVFGSADIEDYSFVKVPADNMIICADGGYKHTESLGLKPAWVVGDFDSSKQITGDFKVERHKSEKDETDMYLVIKKGIELGFKRFVIYGGLGGRLDHTLANIKLMQTCINKGIRLTLIDKTHRIFMIKDESITLKKGAYKYLSVFSASCESKGISVSGVKYPLKDYKMDNLNELGISNEITSDKAKITVKDGTLLIIESSDNHQ